MEELIKKVESYRREIESFAIEGKESAESFRIKYLGTKGLIKNAMSEMKNVPVESKKAFGQIVNDLKLFTENKYEELKRAEENIEVARKSSSQTADGLDLSLPGDKLPLGSRHPISLVRNNIISIFQRLGFAVAEGSITILFIFQSSINTVFIAAYESAIAAPFLTFPISAIVISPCHEYN